MKKCIIYLSLCSLSLGLLGGIGLFGAIQLGMVSRSELAFLVHTTRRGGVGAAYALVRSHILGIDSTAIPNASYGRKHVPGRGHAPWVIRGNLDDRPRILMFALQPRLWAAYDTEAQSLYQLWEGSVQFEGAAFNHQHGPQPFSEGAYYLQNTLGTEWFVDVNGRELPAKLRYLGTNTDRMGVLRRCASSLRRAITNSS